MQLFWKIPLIGPAVFAVWKIDAQRKYRLTKNWIEPQDHLLEVGSGPGSVVEVFREQGLDVTALDIADNSITDDLKPIVYDGDEMPFENRSFDAALLLTMLHHTPNPEHILREAARVSKRLIIMEDIYDTPVQAAYTKLTDKITNMEFIGHPHSNRSHAEWLETFGRLGFTLRHCEIHKLAKLYQQAVYVVDT
ncbi:MAG: methyltransferase domain-containing protein [Parasphingorhabdus sp.]|uniref:class I SAM-dependent methyltransferase n=1 Tax=Alphaproteobacteria TaxID=28211 RepID=UPI003296A15D